ncbi:HNH endonuclease [Sinorhizobium medicae]|uniref:HNH endonuclease n=1 Tax=Sinorhizobium medicae TaxID=110321 RepID=UPI002AF6AE77|nr:HNH endonuclease [Sinorhizobium medicae]WQO60292.1 HNH endonuclease [Sinorhizobium medicae]
MLPSGRPAFIEFDPPMARELFEYDDGRLIWKPRPREKFASDWAWKVWNKRYPGTHAGHRRGDGYRTIRLSVLGLDSPVRSSRIVWVWHNGKWPSELLDHIDHDRGNDRIENLREASNAANCRNKSLLNVGKSGVFGVAFDEDALTWSARVQCDRQVFSLGTFRSKKEAIAARTAAERLLGFHPNHGS